jgi:protein O-GlcNAc transferase
MNPIEHFKAATALYDRGKFSEAVTEYHRYLALEPAVPEAWNDLANCLVQLGKLDDAAIAFNNAITGRPDFGPIHANLAKCLVESGSINSAITLYRNAIELDPSNHEIHSSLLYTLYFAAGMTKAQLIAEHREWARRHADPLRLPLQSHANILDPNRRLKVGYVSPDFTTHPVGRFMLPLFVEHDRERFEVFAYSAVKSPDDLTVRFKKYAGVWRDIVGMKDAAVVELIRADGIDILVDLSMHMGHHLGIFALKPAPVQITYLAYAGTTGLDAMDYRITDRFLEGAAGTEEEFVEKPLFIPSYWCYKPSIWTIESAPPPSINNGFITFGCLNSFKKVSPIIRDIWLELLGALPNSRLMIHAGEGSHRAKFLEACAGTVDPARIEFIGPQPMSDYLRQYNEIDIALDTFPYTGGTTTCDALWMGLPVVTLAGQLAVSRMGVSILGTIGVPELIAHTPPDYISVASNLAGNPAQLATYHMGLRDSMKSSPLMDAKGFARGMELAYRRAWTAWCGGRSENRKVTN